MDDEFIVLKNKRGKTMNEEKLWELINRLPKENITNVLFSVLDSMQSYNGQSRSCCIMNTLDIEYIDGKYKIPTLKHLKEITSTTFLIDV